MPYVSTVPRKLEEPCEGCAAPYGFKHHMRLRYLRYPLRTISVPLKFQVLVAALAHYYTEQLHSLHQGFVSGFNQVSGSGSVFEIRIQIQEGKNDSLK
jgi:hypothetical protein